MRRLLTVAVGLAVGIPPATGCQRPGEREEPYEAVDSVAVEPVAAAKPVAPDTVGAILWAHLTEANYRNNWTHWPEKERFHPGSAPHGALLATYLNDRAARALAAGAQPMPSGAIVVQEDYTADSTLVSIAAMLRKEGYDPRHGDWFWAQYTPLGDVRAAGRVETCRACHGERAANDHLFTREPDPRARG